MLRNSSTSANTETYLGFDAGNTYKAQWNIGIRKTSALSGDFIFNTRTGSSTSGQKLKISHGGDLVMPNDNAKLQIGAGQDLQLYHTGSANHIDSVNGALAIRSDVFQISTLDGTHVYLNIPTDEQGVDLYYDNSKKFETTSGGATVTGQLSVGLNTSSGIDLFHFGNTNFIKPNNGSLDIITPSSNANIARFIPGGAVELWYNASKKLETTSSGATVTGSLTADGISVGDDEFIQAGNSGDVRIFHSGGNNYIGGNGAHDIIFQTSSTGRWRLQSDGHFRPNADSTYDIGTNAIRVRNGYFDTLYGDGSNLTGINTDLVSDTSPQLGGDLDTNSFHINLDDDHAVRFGNSNDLQIYHVNSANTNEFTSALSTNFRGKNLYFYTNHNNSSESAIMCYANQGVELYYDNSKKFETTSAGATITGDLTITDDLFLQDNLIMSDTDIIMLGDGSDLQIQHSGNNSFVDHNGAGDLYIRANGSGEDIYLRAADNILLQPQGGENGIEVKGNAEVALYYDNAVKLQTGSGGDYGSVEAKTGKNGWAGFTIGGYYAFMANNEGNADMCGIYNDLDNEWMAHFERGGKTALYFNGGEKFATTSIGGQLTGQLVVTQAITAQTYMQGTSSNGGLKLYSDSSTSYGVVLDTGDDFRPTHNNVSDLGTASYRWKNVYTNDLNLSNEGSSNDVDGTWGNWTIQEGESDLFLKNNRSGKKYKFNLTEVS